MLAFWIELKRRFKKSWAAIATIASGLVVLLIYLVSKKHQRADDAFERIESKYQQRISTANARAAIEIHVARAKEGDVRKELVDIDRDPDGDRRRQRLIELAARVEGGKS